MTLWQGDLYFVNWVDEWVSDWVSEWWLRKCGSEGKMEIVSEWVCE